MDCCRDENASMELRASQGASSPWENQRQSGKPPGPRSLLVKVLIGPLPEDGSRACGLDTRYSGKKGNVGDADLGCCSVCSLSHVVAIGKLVNFSDVTFLMYFAASLSGGSYSIVLIRDHDSALQAKMTKFTITFCPVDCDCNSGRHPRCLSVGLLIWPGSECMSGRCFAVSCASPQGGASLSGETQGTPC